MLEGQEQGSYQKEEHPQVRRVHVGMQGVEDAGWEGTCGAGTGEHLQEGDTAGDGSGRTLCAESLSSSGADVPTFGSPR